MSLTLFTSVEAPVRDWLRTQSLPGVDARVYVGLPSDATFPALELTMIDGGVQPGDAPVANVMFSFSVWGSGTTGVARTQASATAWALASLLLSTNHAALDGTLVLRGAQIVLGPQPRYDADGTPRYVIDAALTLVKVA